MQACRKVTDAPGEACPRALQLDYVLVNATDPRPRDARDNAAEPSINSPRNSKGLDSLQFAAHSNDALLKRGTEFLRGRSPLLVLAGTREAADDLVRSCCSQAIGALTGVYRHTLRDLVLTISTAPMVERGFSPVHRIAREAIAAEITARSRAKLSYLAPVVGFPGFARALARTLEDIRLNRITTDEL